MLPKAHLTSISRMSGSRWVIRLTDRLICVSPDPGIQVHFVSFISGSKTKHWLSLQIQLQTAMLNKEEESKWLLRPEFADVNHPVIKVIWACPVGKIMESWSCHGISRANKRQAGYDLSWRHVFLTPDGYFTNIFSAGMHWHLVDDQVADVLATNDKVGISKLHSNGIWKKLSSNNI